MNANDYQREAARTLIDGPDFTLANDELMIIWNVIGLAGEAGEIADLVKKGIFHQHGLVTAKVQEELGDLMWYVAALCTKLGISLDDVLSQNIAKLQKRYPDGYSSAASKARVDTKPQNSHYAIIGGYTGLQIGCCWGEQAKIDVLKEEPKATFKIMDQRVCPVCQSEQGHGDQVSREMHLHITSQINQPGIDAVKRASVRSPLPGDMAVCLHCQEQIRYTQYGTWEHTQGIGHENHTAEPHPF